MLAPEDRDQFRRHGYVWLRALLRPTPRPATSDAGPTRSPPGPRRRGAGCATTSARGDAGHEALARIENFVPYHARLAALLTGPKVRGALAECCGEPVVLFKDKINFKLPGGAGFAPHQDAPAYVDFGVEHHLTLMVPVDAVHAPTTGASRCRAGEPRRETLPQNPDGTLRDGVMERWEIEPLLAQPGDVIVFDAWVPHRSGPNRTDGPRRSYYLTFNPASAGDHRAAYYARKRECFPPEYEREPGVDYAARGRQFNLGNPFD